MPVIMRRGLRFMKLRTLHARGGTGTR